MGLLVSVLGTVLVASVGIKVALPKSSFENLNPKDLLAALIVVIVLLGFLGFGFFGLYLKFKLMRNQDKESAEIEKLKLQKEIIELELQKEKSQLPPKDDEN